MRKGTVLMFMLAGLVGGLVAAPIAVYASHNFTDVPGTNTFHSDIEWLAASGVTKGCNPPANTQFCPKDTVTRETLAAFLRRLSENKVVDAATAVDADKVDGFSANEMMRVAFDFTDNVVNANGDAVATSITIPKDGWLILSGGIEASGVPFDYYTCSLTVDGVTVGGTDRTSSVESPGGTHVDNSEEDCSTTGVHPVTGGTTVEIAFNIRGRGTGTLFREASVWALYVPFDGQGNTP